MVTWGYLAGILRTKVTHPASESSLEFFDDVRLQSTIVVFRLSFSILNLPKTVNQIDHFLVVVLRLEDIYDILQL